MNIFDMDGKQMDDLASEYITGMYESQYDDDQSDGNPHIKVVIQKYIKEINEDFPF